MKLIFSPTESDVVFEDQVYLSSQSGTMRLDKFVHCLLVNCSVEVRLPIIKPSVNNVSHLEWLNPLLLNLYSATKMRVLVLKGI